MLSYLTASYVNGTGGFVNLGSSQCLLQSDICLLYTQASDEPNWK